LYQLRSRPVALPLTLPTAFDPIFTGRLTASRDLASDAVGDLQRQAVEAGVRLMFGCDVAPGVPKAMLPCSI
jgi:hypothetical protein